MFKNKTKLLAGTNIIKSEPRIIFSKIACDFLEELSKNLLKNKKAKIYQDVVSFAFWCRKSNIDKIKNNSLKKTLDLD